MWDFPEDIPAAAHENKHVSQLIHEDIEQGTDAWLELRAGKITGSKISHMMAKGKGLTKDSYRTQLAVERITGKPVPMTFKSKAMIKGSEDEPLAREHYEFVNNVDAKQVAFILHPFLLNAGASPDSLIGDDGLLEIKCPNSETHINYLITKKIPGDYMDQMQWQLACSKRSWVDWMTYDKSMPIHLRSMVIRVYRDEKRIIELEGTAEQFNEEINELVIKLGKMQ
jgi:putative phage-type endonuclease